MYIKKGQKMPWMQKKEYITRLYGYSEQPTSESTLPAGTKLFHGSYWKLNGFASCMTCFTPEQWAYKNGLGISGYTYIAILKKSIPAIWFGDDEIRIEISPENCDMYYLGTVRRGKILYVATECRNQYPDLAQKIHAYAPQFAEIAEKLNEFEKKSVEWKFYQNKRIAGYVPA